MIAELWPGGPQLKDKNDVFPLGMDSVLLADFAKRVKTGVFERAIDLGCGSGVISLLLAWDNEKLHVDGVEIQPVAARLARENAGLNSLTARIDVIQGDLRHYRDLFKPGTYDLVISNPPYQTPGSGKRSVTSAITIARAEVLCTLEDICKAARFLTRWGGSLVFAYRPERLVDAFRITTANGFEPKRVRFVHHTQNSPPSLVLIENKLGAKPSLKVEPPLILKNEDGSDSDETKAIYRL